MRIPTPVDFLQELVRIPSVNPNYGAPDAESGEERIAARLADVLTGFGFDVELQQVAPGRPNVVARRGGAGGRSLAFCAHTDTVPSAGMTVDPFAAEVRDGRVRGRGACDTKASVAAACLAAIAEDGVGMPGIVLVLTCDEENGFAGVRRYLRDMPDRLAGVVVGEPTAGRCVTAHKSVFRFRVRAAGVAAHSSTPHLGENAIYRMARAVTAVEELAARYDARPAHPLLGAPTVSVGVIRGGTAVNAVPDHAEIEIDARGLPGMDAEDVRADLAEAVGSVEGVVVDPPGMVMPALETDPDHPLARCVREAVGAETGTVAFGTDGAFFHEAGVPTVVFGPGDAARAHTKDESVGVDELERGVEAYRAIIRAAGPLCE